MHSFKVNVKVCLHIFLMFLMYRYQVLLSPPTFRGQRTAGVRCQDPIQVPMVLLVLIFKYKFNHIYT